MFAYAFYFSHLSGGCQYEKSDSETIFFTILYLVQAENVSTIFGFNGGGCIFMKDGSGAAFLKIQRNFEKTG